MEYIIVPTDFSDSAFNALEYAINLAKFFNSKIIVLNTIEQPTANVSSFMKIEDKMKDLAEADLIKLRKILDEKGLLENVEIEFENSFGSIMSGIKYQLKTKDIGLVVMGTTGSSGLKEIFLGSNTFSVVKKSEIPVLAVPEKARFTKIKNIIFATDFKMKCDSENLPVIFQIAKLFDAKLTLINIQTVKMSFTDTRKNADEFFTKCKHLISDIEYEYHYILDDDIPHGINKAYLNNEADLLVMVKKSYSLIEHMYKKSYTQKLIYDARLPLLTIKE